MSTPQPRIVSDWAATDQSTNHLEIALTDALVKGQNGQQQVMALRDTYNPGTVIFVTPGQIMSFARSTATQDSPAGRLLAAATSSR